MFGIVCVLYGIVSSGRYCCEHWVSHVNSDFVPHTQNSVLAPFMYKGLLNTVLIIAQMSPKPEMLGGQKFGRRSGPMHVQWAAML